MAQFPYAPPQSYPAAPAFARPSHVPWAPELQSARRLGALGSILLILLPLPYLGGVLAIAGLVLILVALKTIAGRVGNPAIFDRALYSVVLAVAGVVISMVAMMAAVFALIGFDAATWPNMMGDNFTPAQWWAFGGMMFLALLALWGFFLASAYFMRLSLNGVADALGIPLFRTAGTVYFVGAALTIVLVGFLVLFVAFILFALAFFAMAPPAAAPAQPGYPQGFPGPAPYAYPTAAPGSPAGVVPPGAH